MLLHPEGGPIKLILMSGLLLTELFDVRLIIYIRTQQNKICRIRMFLTLIFKQKQGYWHWLFQQGFVTILIKGHQVSGFPDLLLWQSRYLVSTSAASRRQSANSLVEWIKLVQAMPIFWNSIGAFLSDKCIASIETYSHE